MMFILIDAIRVKKEDKARCTLGVSLLVGPLISQSDPLMSGFKHQVGDEEDTQLETSSQEYSESGCIIPHPRWLHALSLMSQKHLSLHGAKNSATYFFLIDSAQSRVGWHELTHRNPVNLFSIKEPHTVLRHSHNDWKPCRGCTQCVPGCSKISRWLNHCYMHISQPRTGWEHTELSWKHRFELP